MLRPSRQASSILPNHGGGSSSTNIYVGYGNGGYCSDPYAKSSLSSARFGKRRPSYSSSDILPSLVKNSTSWLALGLAFFIFLSGYYQSKFHWVLRELNADSVDQVVQKYRDLYTEKVSRKRASSEIEERYSILERLNAKLHKEKEDLRSTYEKKMMKEFTNRRQEENRLIAREEAFKAQIKVLQEVASRDARRAVTEK